MSQAAPLILAVGEILWDLLPAGRQLGGAPANFAYHAGQLGADARVVSAVGDDGLGREMLAELRGRGVDTALITVGAGRPTGTVSVSVAAGQPAYTIHEGVAWDALPPPTPALRDLARRADCVCFGTLAQRSIMSRRTIAEILAASPPDALRVLEVNLRQRFYDRPTVEASLVLAGVLKINDQELPVVGKLLDVTGPTPAGLFERFPGLRLIALTRGGRGSILYAPDGTVHEHPGHPVDDVVDTIGAGDAFTAALAVGLLRGVPLGEINDRANRLAAYVCTRPGATPPIPPELRAQVAG
jgi:fructokinase